MYKTCLLTAILSVPLFVTAQSTSPDVISSAGDHYVGTNTQWSWTIGEPVIQTYSGSNAMLSQGLHQPSLIITGIEDKKAGAAFKVYPNPAGEMINIESSNKGATYSVTLYDLSGKLLLSETANAGTSTINFSGYANGTYVLNLTDEQSQIIKTVKVQKTN